MAAHQVGDAVIEKSVTLIHGQDTVVVAYKLISRAAGAAGAIKLQVQPMLAGRDFHHTIQPNYRPSWVVTAAGSGTGEKNQIGLSAHECPVRVVLSHNAERFNVSPCWWYNFIFRQEQMRGYPDRDDLWTPGTAGIYAGGGQVGGLHLFSTKGVPFEQHAELISRETARFNALTHAFDTAAGRCVCLDIVGRVSDQFVVQAGGVATGNTPGADQRDCRVSVV